MNLRKELELIATDAYIKKAKQVSDAGHVEEKEFQSFRDLINGDFKLGQVVFRSIFKPLLFLLLFLSFSTSATNGNRGSILCEITKKKASIFLNHIWGPAEQACKEFDKPLGLLLAVAVLESGWGISDIYNRKCNPCNVRRNHEYCRYDSLLEGFRDACRVLDQDCYKEVPTTSISLWLYQMDYCCFHMGGALYSKKAKSIYYKYGLDQLNDFKTK